MDFGIQFAFWQIVGRLGLAVLVGSALGINRNLRRKPAGIRTHALVSLSTAMGTTLRVTRATRLTRGDVCSAGHGACLLFAWSTLGML